MTQSNKQAQGFLGFGKPAFITFTGVDERTDFHEMERMSREYPIEWGVLFSPKRQGIEPRYPNLEQIGSRMGAHRLRYAAHLCGGDARDWIERDHCSHEHLLPYFSRVQINTASPDIKPDLIGQSAARRNVRAIVQCRGEFPQVSAVDLLFDASGGRGIFPNEWPASGRTTNCGYAGGLNPENVAAAVEQISKLATRYWIDMESGVRDENDYFDLARCRAICEAVYGL